MRRRRDQGAGHAPSHGIDLAPMLDFVINLLIFFIITAVFLKESGITVNRPTSFASSSVEDVKAIEILESGEIQIDGKPVDIRAVRDPSRRHRRHHVQHGEVNRAKG